MGGIILDIIVVAIILLSTFLGYKKGIVSVVFKLLSFFIAIVLMLVLYKPVSSYVINHTEYDEKLQTVISEKLSSTNIQSGTTMESSKEDDYSEIVVNYINKYVNEATSQGKSDIVKYVSEKLAIISINAITAIGLFLAINGLLLIVQLILKLLTDLPILSQFDKMGGIIFGLVKGVLSVYVILAILSVCSAVLTDIGILSIIQSSHVANYMFNHNIILKLIMK